VFQFDLMKWCFASVIFTATMALCTPSRAAAAAAVDFAHDVVPILKARCVECHGGEKAEGGVSMNTRASLLESGVVEPGDAAASLMIEIVSSTDPEYQMPPKDRTRLPPEEIDVLRRWVEAKLPWEDGFTFAPTRYEPPLEPRRPELPATRDGRENPVDRILDAYLAERDLPRPAPLDDAQFMRRAHFDIIGLPPTADELKAFLTDPATDKRATLIDKLLADNEAYATHWLTFWNDLLRNSYSGTGYIDGGRKQITTWLFRALVENKPFDQFVRELIAPTAESEGFINGIKWRGDVNASQTREVQFAQNVGQVLLGINLKCASCHDSFIDHWTLAETYSLAAVVATEPLELHRCDKPQGTKAEAAWLFPELGSIDPAAPKEARLEQLAALMTHPQNGRVSRTIVNRIWHRMMGRGIVHPVDAMNTPPWNADLLDYLAVHFTDHRYDLKEAIRLIANSNAYQSRCAVVEEEAASGDYVYAGPIAKRMSVEQFLDAVWSITDTWPEPDERAFGRRDDRPGGQLTAVMLARDRADVPHTSEQAPPPDAKNEAAYWKKRWGDRPVRAALTPIDLFQASLGRPNREQVVTSRPAELTTLEAITLANGAALAELMGKAAENVSQREQKSADELVKWLYLAALSREPSASEREVLLSAMSAEPSRQEVEDLLWNIFMLPEFQLIR
jgi:mono/diheme cytochrome c family protein